MAAIPTATFSGGITRAPERNREHSIRDQMAALNVALMEHLHSGGGTRRKKARTWRAKLGLDSHRKYLIKARDYLQSEMAS